MPATKLLTTAEAEALYGVPAGDFVTWCREGKIPGARKRGGKWLMPQKGVDAFFAHNPNLRPSILRRLWTIIERYAWPIFVIIATILGFINDTFEIPLMVGSGDLTWLWWLLALIGISLWFGAWYVVRDPRKVHIAAPVKMGARVLLWGIPILTAAIFVSYNAARVIPPRQTVVLVADFLTPDGRDPTNVTERLTKGMQDTLAGHPNIQVKRLKRAISEEQGSQEARIIGNRPEHKAAFVIWGDYVLEPEPELYVHFDILRQTETYLGTGDYDKYGPMDIQQPSMFDFKLELGPYLGQLTAFASGLALYDAGNYKEALPLFDTAAQAYGQRLAAQWERAIRFYRGVNFLELGRARDAESDLAILVPDPSVQVFDEIALAALSNLGVVAQTQGDYAAAKDYLGQALALDRQLGNSLGEADQLGNLGLVARDQGDYEAAKAYHEQALVLHRQLGNPLGEAADLGNLGLVAYEQGDYEAAKAYHEQALVLHRQLGNPSGEAGSLDNLGLVARVQGDYAMAKDYHEQALALHRQLGNLLDEAGALTGLGLVARVQGDLTAAKDYHEQALALYRQLDNPLGEAIGLSNFGAVAGEQGNYAVAKDHLEQALALHRQLGTPLEEAADLGNLGLVAEKQGDYAAAKDYLYQSLALYRQLGNPLGEADQLGNLGLVARQQGDYAAARAYLEQSTQLYHQLGLPVHPAVQSALDSLPAP
jgi:tetratricopeptide (TPR) repeat protein